MTSTALMTQIDGTEHRPFQNVLGSVGITNIPAVTLIGPVSTMVAGGAIQLIPPVPVIQTQFGLSSTIVGQRTMAMSIPVTLASDQPNINVNATLTPVEVQAVQFGFSSATLGQKTMTLSIPVTLASNQPAIPVSGTFTANEVQSVQFGLSSVIAGQRAMTFSVPVTLASDQNFVDVKHSALRTLFASFQYQDIPRASANITLGSAGALGDYLDLLLCMVSTTGGARVSVRDGAAGDVINLLPQTPGGGIGPYHIVFGYPSRHGAWQITTDSGVSVRATGIFT